MKSLLFLLSLFVTFANADYKLDELRLKNGMRVIFIEKKTVPIISLSIWYKCGSQCDTPFKSGVAHFLEHMAFLSNKREFSHYLDEIGATSNAFTSINIVCFYEIFRKNHLEKVLSYEAHRMRNLKIEDEVFQSEKMAILEERGMRIDSNPDGIYQEILSASLFNRQIGGVETLGWKHEIETIEKKDLLAFHKRWIVPNNAIMIIVGDFDLALSKRLVEKYFGNIPATELSNRVLAEYKGHVPKEVEYRSVKNGSLALVEYVYKVPFEARKNLRKSIALSMSVEILNQSTFFVESIMKKVCDIVSSVNFACVNRLYQYDILRVTFNTNSVDDLNSVEQMWPYFRKKISDNCISEEDLERRKKRNLISLSYEKEDIEQISNYFGLLLNLDLSLDDIRSVDSVIQSVTVKECNEVLKEVFSQRPIMVMKAMPKGYDRD